MKQKNTLNEFYLWILKLFNEKHGKSIQEKA